MNDVIAMPRVGLFRRHRESVAAEKSCAAETSALLGHDQIIEKPQIQPVITYIDRKFLTRETLARVALRPPKSKCFDKDQIAGAIRATKPIDYLAPKFDGKSPIAKVHMYLREALLTAKLDPSGTLDLHIFPSTKHDYRSEGADEFHRIDNFIIRSRIKEIASRLREAIDAPQGDKLTIFEYYHPGLEEAETRFNEEVARRNNQPAKAELQA